MTAIQVIEAQLSKAASVCERVDLGLMNWPGSSGRQEPERSLHLLEEVKMLACTSGCFTMPYALGLAQCQANLARVEHFQGHYETALAYALDAIARCEQINHPSTLQKRWK